MTAFGTQVQPFRKVDKSLQWALHTPHAQSTTLASLPNDSQAQLAERSSEDALDEGRVRARTAFAATGKEQATCSDAEKKGALGYKQGMLEVYRWAEEIGRGANGIVKAVLHIPSGKEYACKTIPKVLSDGASPEKKAGHLASITKEISVMKKLRSCLNVAKLIDVYEDDTHVHIISEWCKGGALTETAGTSHYSERTVASYMRGVLRTLAQCHANNILHRDVKPGNFLLLSEDVDAPIKAIDFGLAEEYNSADELPLTHLGMEGTPWFLSPEAISSRWSPSSDIWAAGVMAYQLLSGRMPFDDRRNPFNPALTAVLRSILTDKLDFSKPCWAEISDEAKDFVKSMLNRDPSKRPTAREALKHPWLSGDVSDRKLGKQLNLNVVQRIQRYGHSSPVKRNMFEMIVSEVMDDVSPSGPDACPVDSKMRAVIDSRNSSAISTVLQYLNLNKNSTVGRETVAAGLENMGYRITDGELERLMEIVGDDPEKITKDSVIASQIDWHHLQKNQTAHWLKLLERAFANIDTNKDGVVDMEEMIQSFKHRLPAHEVEQTYVEAMRKVGDEGRAPARMDFPAFVQLMRMSSRESLDLYDDRLEGSIRSLVDYPSPHSSVNNSMHYACSSVPVACSTQHRSLASHVLGSMNSSCGSFGSLSSLASLDLTRHGPSLPTVFEKAKEV